MKNTIIKTLTALSLVLFAFSAMAQGQLSKGNAILQGGIALGSSSAAYTTSEIPLINVTYEKGIKDNFGNGSLSVGGTVGFKSGKSNGFGVDWNYNYMAIAARASWHPYFIKSEKVDAYTGLSLGYHRVAVNTTRDFEVNASSAEVVLAFHVGARYHINENLAAFGELGYGLGFLNVGIAYKF